MLSTTYQGCQVGLFWTKFQKAGFVSSWLTSKVSFDFLAFFWPRLKVVGFKSIVWSFVFFWLYALRRFSL